MPHDQPALPDLITTVRAFIEELVPDLSGQQRYHALCSVYLLQIVERELDEWAPLETADDRRLRGLLDQVGIGAEAGHPAHLLSSAIRDGKFDTDLDALLQPLLEHVRAKATVARPDVLEQTDREASLKENQA